MVPDLIRKVLDGQRPLEIFGDGTQTRTLTHVDDIADGIVTAMASPAALNEDFNISASDERTVAELARLIWEACGEPPEAFELAHKPSFEVDVVAPLARRLQGARAARLGGAGADRGRPRRHGRVAALQRRQQLLGDVERLTHAVVHVDVDVVGQPAGEVRRRADLRRARGRGSGR